MALDADLERITAEALRARTVADFLAIVERLRAVEPEDAAKLLALIQSLPAASRGLADVLRSAMLEAALAASASLATSDVARRALASADRQLADVLEARVREDARRRAAELDGRMRAAFGQASRLARAGAPIDVVRSPVLGAAASVKATLATEVTQTAGLYVTSVADEAGVATIWVAETNACVRCLAYSGRIAEPGEDFPGGLSYGRRPKDRTPIAFPPLHPNCRCFVEPLGSREYADALRREADRSVLRGFSLESESMATRVDAARRLLERGVDAPASVIRYAERSVEAGRFATRDR